MINANIVPGKYTDKKGKIQIYLQVSINRKVKRLKLFKADPAEFDGKRQTMKKNHNRENLIISTALAKIEELNLTDPDATFKTVELAVSGRTADSNVDLLSLAHTPATICAVKTLLEVIPGAKLKQIGSREVELWAKHTSTTRCKLTAHRYLQYLKAVFNQAVKDGLIKNNPFAELSLPRQEPHREYLTMEELSAIEALELSAIERVYRDMFLVECYTGLRVSDIKTLQWTDIREGAICKKMIKTKTEVFIPLNNKAASIIERQPHTGELVFKKAAATLPTINKYIKGICHRAGITKKITSHCGRHTFAVQSLNKRIPIEVVSKLLGHRDLKTTQIYAKVANPLIVDYMKRWDE